MKKVFLTGANGFVGKNLTLFLQNNTTNSIVNYDKNMGHLDITNLDVVIHLAGKAHDLNNVDHAKAYYEINTNLTKKVFDVFIKSNAKVFITLSSVKAATDELYVELTEEHLPNPITHYGKSKLLAEQYILSKDIPHGKRVYILRPCMIHGPGNKGNLNLLYKIVSKGFPWPLGVFDNKRSFCSIDNLCFVINELIQNDQVPSGVYNIADDEALSTNEVISLLAVSQNRKRKIWFLPKGLIKAFAKLGDLLQLPLTTERLQKLTESYVVSNQKIKSAIGKNLQVSAKEGLLKTFNSFHTNAK